MEQNLDQIETETISAEESQTTSELEQLAQLRVQNYSLESRLAKVTEQLDETRQSGSRSRRNGNGRHRGSGKQSPLKRMLGK